MTNGKKCAAMKFVGASKDFKITRWQMWQAYHELGKRVNDRQGHIGAFFYEYTKNVWGKPIWDIHSAGNCF